MMMTYYQQYLGMLQIRGCQQKYDSEELKKWDCST